MRKYFPGINQPRGPAGENLNFIFTHLILTHFLKYLKNYRFYQNPTDVILIPNFLRIQKSGFWIPG